MDKRAQNNFMPHKKVLVENSFSCLLWQVPHRAEEISIPADVTPEKVPTHIVDYSGNMIWSLKYSIQSGWCQMPFIVKVLMNYPEKLTSVSMHPNRTRAEWWSPQRWDRQGKNSMQNQTYCPSCLYKLKIVRNQKCCFSRCYYCQIYVWVIWRILIEKFVLLCSSNVFSTFKKLIMY